MRLVSAHNGNDLRVILGVCAVRLLVTNVKGVPLEHAQHLLGRRILQHDMPAVALVRMKCLTRHCLIIDLIDLKVFYRIGVLAVDEPLDLETGHSCLLGVKGVARVFWGDLGFQVLMLQERSDCDIKTY